MPTNTQTKGKRGGVTKTTWKKGMPPPNPKGRVHRNENNPSQKR